VKFLITAGPTREPIDPVRFISNRSSGKMGYAIAEAAIAQGHEVVLISGPVFLQPPPAARLISVSTGDEMFEGVDRNVSNCDVFVMCAAVADYKPAKVSDRKIKRGGTNLSLELVPTRDILAFVSRKDRSFLAVGFAAETNDLEENARKKLHQKKLDIIVANEIGLRHSAVNSDENEVIILFDHGETREIARAPKKIIARELVNIFETEHEKRLTKKMP
jgi:phosphopantothenoylcysteine decarboxylase/phosphopantothenate--cysteine ligase